MDTEGAIRNLLCGALLATWATIAGAAEFLGPVVGVLVEDTIEVLHTNTRSASVSMPSTVLRKAKPMASEPSKPRLS
ncbi:MAG: hypothetical protein ABI980_12965 [Nitrospirota bacterium]